MSTWKFTPYSFSKVATHKGCNRKFKYNYIDKAPRQKRDMTALLKGGALHSILEHFPEATNHKLASKYFHIAEKFLKSELGIKYFNVKSIRELSFGLDENLQPCEYSDKKAIFKGFIDYICTVDDVLHLVDWKSGKYKDQKFQDYSQLLYYAIFFFKKYPTINKINISYVYIEHENLENVLTLERQYLDNYIDDLMSSIYAVENDVEFKKNVGPLCNYCDFQEHCNNDVWNNINKTKPISKEKDNGKNRYRFN